MKKILLVLVLLFVVLIGVAVIVPQFIPTETYKNLATEQVKNATGRDLDIRGKVSISVLPRLAVELNDVTFSNAPGSKEKHMVKLSQLALNLKLLPLLSGEVEIATFVLRDPTIFLEVDKNGRPNWEFQTTSKPTPKEPAPKTETPKSSGGGSGIALPVSDIRLGEVGILSLIHI